MTAEAAANIAKTFAEGAKNAMLENDREAVFILAACSAQYIELAKNLRRMERFAGGKAKEASE